MAGADEGVTSVRAAGSARSAGTVADGARSSATLAERLGLWLDWTDAITLSAALHGAPPAARPDPETGAPGLASTIADEVLRVRAGLVKAIAAEGLFAQGKSGPLDGATDFPACRRAYLAHQRVMAARLGALRVRVRAALSATSPSLQRLAALDAAMADALAAREGHLLAKVPGLLEPHFERLRGGQTGPLADAQPPGAPEAPGVPGGGAPSTAWLAEFLRHLQAVLLAELELRLQPIEAMMDVLTNALGGEAARRA